MNIFFYFRPQRVIRYKITSEINYEAEQIYFFLYHIVFIMPIARLNRLNSVLGRLNDFHMVQVDHHARKISVFNRFVFAE